MLFTPFPPTVNYIRNARLIRIIDGDTLEVMIDDGRKSYAVERLRLYGVDTPENTGPEKYAGLYVENQVTKWVGFPDFDQIVINSVKFNIDSFSRIICEVWVRDVMLNKWLLDEGYGWPTDKKGKLTVPRTISTLNLPSQILTSIREASL